MLLGKPNFILAIVVIAVISACKMRTARTHSRITNGPCSRSSTLDERRINIDLSFEKAEQAAKALLLARANYPQLRIRKINDCYFDEASPRVFVSVDGEGFPETYDIAGILKEKVEDLKSIVFETILKADSLVLNSDRVKEALEKVVLVRKSSFQVSDPNLQLETEEGWLGKNQPLSSSFGPAMGGTST